MRRNTHFTLLHDRLKQKNIPAGSKLLMVLAGMVVLVISVVFGLSTNEIFLLSQKVEARAEGPIPRKLS